MMSEMIHAALARGGVSFGPEDITVLVAGLESALTNLDIHESQRPDRVLGRQANYSTCPEWRAGSDAPCEKGDSDRARRYLERAAPDPWARLGGRIGVSSSARMWSVCPSCRRRRQGANHGSRSGSAVAPAVRLGDRLAYPVARLHRRHGLLHRDPGRNAPGDG